MASEAEKLEISVLGGLYSVTEENLKKWLSHLNITDTESKTKRQVLKLARNAIETGVQVKSEEEAVEYLKILQSFIFDALPPLEDDEATEDPEKNADITHWEKKLAAIEAKKEKQISDLKLKLDHLKLGNHANSLFAEVQDAEKPLNLNLNLDTKTCLFRKELKISGSIGHPNETNKLTFITLIHQIDAAVAKGSHDSEICEAVIKAISPGMTLRGFLECKPDLNLLTLKKILHSHFKEKSATDLYKSLTTLAQLPSEDPHMSLFRGLELRQKVIFASKAINPKNPCYTVKMIQEHFLRAIETGMREEAVRAKLRPYLQTCNIEHDKLIAQLTRVCAEESEQDSKLGKQRVKVARIESKGKCSSESLTEKPLSNQCLATFNTVQLQLKELRSEVCKLRKSKQ